MLTLIDYLAWAEHLIIGIRGMRTPIPIFLSVAQSLSLSLSSHSYKKEFYPRRWVCSSLTISSLSWFRYLCQRENWAFGTSSTISNWSHTVGCVPTVLKPGLASEFVLFLLHPAEK